MACSPWDSSCTPWAFPVSPVWLWEQLFFAPGARLLARPCFASLLHPLHHTTVRPTSFAAQVAAHGRPFRF